jgi:ABC-type phosphate transport system substrate-binding protein
MRHRWIFCVLVPAACWTPASAERLGGDGFSDPDFIWQSVPSGWIQRAITPEVGAQHADLVISLDQQLYPYLLPLIDEYAKKHGLTIATTKGTCGISAGLLFRKAIDIGGFCCAPAETDRLPGLRFHTLAIAAIALIVHPANPVENVTLAQARGLFRGEISDWSTVIDHPNPAVSGSVHPVARLHCKLRPGHWRLLLDNEELFSPDLLDVGAIEDMLRSVAADPQAIGYETLWMVRSQAAGGAVKTLRLNGIDPNDSEALAQGHYPLYRVYNVTTWEGAAGKPLANELVRYLLDRVEEADSRFFMVPVSRLRTNGWRFEADELVGEPESSAVRKSPRVSAKRAPSFDAFLAP